MTARPSRPSTPRIRQELLYEAERWAGVHSTARRYRDIRDLTRRVLDICGSDWWIERYPTIPAPGVSRIRSKRWGGVSGRATIGIADPTDHVILHELAHYLTDALHPDDDIGHGPEFARNLLTLYREFSDVVSWANLRNGLEKVGYWG